ncbi:hypothetical protein GGS21DRAFT_544594 [Xylaria nigripes]|nr:hypothetical protein GGS21DRAFT_544594 [Xylaria nigripes]
MQTFSAGLFSPRPQGSLRRNQRPITISYSSHPTYDDTFESQLVENGIYPPLYQHPDQRATQEPLNLHRIRRGLEATRLPVLSISDAQLLDFKLNTRSASENKLLRALIQNLFDSETFENESGVPFTNLNTMLIACSFIKPPVPHYYEGARPSDIYQHVKTAIGKLIMPTTCTDIPAVPNFFFEVRTGNRGADGLRRQACYDGAYGARSMFMLQNYCNVEPVYDGNAYTFSATYHAGTGTLQLYAHHTTQPIALHGMPEYHMTEIDAFALTANNAAFVRGASAIRALRQRAARYRNTFIANANHRATHSAFIPESSFPMLNITPNQIPNSPWRPIPNQDFNNGTMPAPADFTTTMPTAFVNPLDTTFQLTTTVKTPADFTTTASTVFVSPLDTTLQPPTTVQTPASGDMSSQTMSNSSNTNSPESFDTDGIWEEMSRNQLAASMMHDSDSLIDEALVGEEDTGSDESEAS